MRHTHTHAFKKKKDRRGLRTQRPRKPGDREQLCGPDEQRRVTAEPGSVFQ